MVANDLEKLLLRSLKDRNYYGQFISHLLKNDVYVPCVSAINLEIPLWRDKEGKKFVPFFSSLHLLRKGCHMVGNIQEKHIKLPTHTLFHELNNVHAVLNPNLAHTKEFSMEEIEQLKHQYYSSWLLSALPGSKLLLFQPIKLPLQALQRLVKIFKKHPTIALAFYSKINLIDDGMIYEYDLIGIKAINDFYRMFANLESDLNVYAKELVNFKFIDINQSNEIIAHLKNQEAFYII